MLFNSLTFLLFFAVVLVADRLLPSWRGRKAMLLAASYVFYGAWNPPLALLLALSTAIDWEVSRRLAKTAAPTRRRLLVTVSLLVNLGLLAAFKYGTFLIENFQLLLRTAGVEWTPAPYSIVLPVGISFYTFQTLSYTLDVYRGRMAAWDSLLDFALYVSFFPQLVAGPIVRAAEFLPQCIEPPRVSGRQLGWGSFLLTVGLFQKVVLADTLLAPAADAVYGWAFGPVAPADAWLGTLAFSGQIFCDFAGYSTCAIGVALCLGFALPDNFRRPYGAIGFRDFWRRWHITLSTWLRDYLYIPLGGSRHGQARTVMALMLTMLLGGLWHGAAWTFVVWGGLHGLFLVAERFLARVFAGSAWLRRWPARLLLGALTYVLVLVTWVFFRATSFGQAGLVLAAMAGVVTAGAKVLGSLDVALVLGVSAALLLTHAALRERSTEELAARLPGWFLATAWGGMLFSLYLAQGGGDAFIYFQF